MKSFISIISAALAATTLAAPTTQKRSHTKDFTVSLYTETGWNGDKFDFPVHFEDEQSAYCAVPDFGANDKNFKAITLSESQRGIACRFYSEKNCPETAAIGWFIDTIQPDLEAINAGGASSLWCQPRPHDDE